MKKIVVFLLLIVGLLNVSPTSTSASDSTECASDIIDNYDFDYSDIANGTDYTRICKNAVGEWLGVIDITNIRLDLSGMSSYGGSYHTSELYIAFSRDLEALVEVNLIGTPVNVCNLLLSFYGTCVLGSQEQEPKDYTIYNKYTDGGFMDWLANDKIQTTNIDGYDYHIHIDDALKEVDVVSFTYILTEAEIDSLNLDIQTQYELEFNSIANNPLLTDQEREQQLLTLQKEYENYTVAYGEELTSPCVGDDCHVEADDDDWLEKLLNDLIMQIAIVIASLLSGGMVIFIIYRIITTTSYSIVKNVTLGSAKLIHDSGSYWASVILKGLYNLVNTFHSSITNVFGKYSIVFYICIVASVILIVF